MRKLNKSIAVLTAATMVLSPVSVFAATGSTTSEGNSVIENDNSTAPSYSRIVLPTVAANQYDFTLDPEGLLEKYNDYTEATLYFANSIAASIVNPESTTSDGKLYVPDITKDTTGIDDLKAAITAADSKVSAVGPGLYLWVPDTNAGALAYAGTYLPITAENIDTYFDITYTNDTTVNSVAVKAKHLAGKVVCDGNIYKDDYRQFDPSKDDLTDYGTISEDGQTFTYNEGLYVKESGNPVAIDSSNESKYIEFTAADSGYSDTSDVITITNKSTFETTVTATITVENTGDLAFGTSSTLTTEDLYIAITDGGSNTKAVATTTVDDTTVASATLSVDLAAPSMSPITYQTEQTDPVTGGHVYAQYEPTGVAYNSVDLTITGASKTGDKYEEYLESLTAESRPTINVVYSFENDSNAATVAASGTWSGSTLWLSVDGTNGFATTPTSVKVSDDGSTYANVSYTYEGNGWISIPWSNITAAGCTTGKYVEIIVSGTRYLYTNESL